MINTNNNYVINLLGFLIIASMNFSSPVFANKENEQYQRKRLDDAAKLIQAKKPRLAIKKYIIPVIDFYNKKYPDSKGKVFSAHSQKEKFAYLLDASANKKNVKVISINWSAALFLKAYCLIELKLYSEARTALVLAIERSPKNASYLSELAHLYQLDKNLPKAIETYQKALKATAFSPSNIKNIAICRAQRGIGYIYIEQKRYPEAKKMYEQCLKVYPNDKKSLHELKYIKHIQNK